MRSLRFLKAGALLMVGGLTIVVLIAGFIGFRSPAPIRAELNRDLPLSYEETIAQLVALQAEESTSGRLHPNCHSILLTHDRKAEHAFVLFHGLTSCPKQLESLGRIFFENGHNVYIPRLPLHGLADIADPSNLNGLSAENLAAFAIDSERIGAGLGEQVHSLGFSAGGTISIWLAGEGDATNSAVAISPFLGVGFIPPWLTKAFTNIVLLMPDTYFWWDPILRADSPFIDPYQYPGFSTHALGEFLRLGFDSITLRDPVPEATSLLVITNENDNSVNNLVTGQRLSAFSSWPGIDYRWVEFDASMRLPHDFISLDRPFAHPKLIYPVLVQLVEETIASIQE